MVYVVRVESEAGELRGYLCKKRVVRLVNATKYASPSAARASMSTAKCGGILAMREWRAEQAMTQSESDPRGPQQRKCAGEGVAR